MMKKEKRGDLSRGGEAPPRSLALGLSAEASRRPGHASGCRGAPRLECALQVVGGRES